MLANSLNKVNTAKNPVGVFDSGVGGLSVLKELVKSMPKENYIFVADQANVPYGEKTREELKKITLKVCDFLTSKNCKIIVAACNTATCYSLDFLRANIEVPIVGTVPAVKPAAEKSSTGVVGIVSTPATSKSAYLKKLVKDHAGGVRVVNVGCPNLENAVEAGSLNSPEVRRLLLKYVGPIKKAGADVIVLGCTHYPFLKSQIRKVAGKNVKIFDSGKAIAKRTKEILRQVGALNSRGGPDFSKSKKGFRKIEDSRFTNRALSRLRRGFSIKSEREVNRNRMDFYTTGSPDQFSKVASSLLRVPVRAKHLHL